MSEKKAVKKIKWSPKSIEAVAKAHLAKINLLEGVVRSSKSFTADYIAIKIEVPRLPACNVLVSGFSADSARQNIIAEWEDKLGAAFKEHRDSKGTYYTISIKGLHNKRFYIRGGGKNGDEKAIKGMTFGYWYGDEMTEHTSEFVQMALSRLSKTYSKAIWTTNPAGPTNHIKKEYMDKQAKLKGVFQSFKFDIFDNPSLDKEYIRSLEQLYHGVFYQRNIRGKWVAAEGHIYTMFEDDNVTDYIPAFPEKIYIGVDYGTSNQTSFGKVYLEKGVYYVVDEFHYSGAGTGHNKSPSEFVDDLKDFIGEDYAKVSGIYVDPSANFFVTECKKAGIGKFKKANNEVLEGIQLMQNLFANKTFRVYFKCSKSISEIQSYKWDKTHQEKGEDVPVKEDDHFPDLYRYIMASIMRLKSLNAKTTNSSRNIKNITKNY